jgi:Zn-dependent metalloprotease
VLRKVLLVAATLALLGSAAAVAQAAPRGKAASTNPRTAAAKAAADLVAGRPARLRASSADAFVQRSVISTPEGLQYVPYVRTYKGLPVVGGDFVVITRASDVLSTSVAQRSQIDVSTSPAVSARRAGQIARGELAGANKLESTRLVVQAQLGEPRLAYESVVIGHRGALPSRLHVFVDAQTGAVLATEDEVKDGSGTGWINGPTPLFINTSGSGSSFSMTDSTRPGISCRNYSTNTVLTGTDDVWGNGNGTSIETGCVDALWDVQREWDMLSSWLGRSGINGSGSGFPLRVGLNDVNAFWNGSYVAIGHNTVSKWISSLDVVGHEFGHAIDSTTPGGQSANGVSEATGDVFGALTEGYANEPAAYDPPDYSVGEEVNLDGSGPIRQMYNPSLVGDPNCYSSSVPNMETHAAAGPFDHWFYLVAEGSSPANGQPSSPTCNGTTVTGLGLQKAGRIFYNAMLSKTSGMTYLRYRTATLNAAKNLFPGGCTEFDTVKAAWNAVSVPAQAGDPTCTVNGAVSVNNPGNRTGTVGAATSLQLTASGGSGSYSWSAAGLPPGLSINASSGVISGTPTTAGAYTVTATATSGGQSGSTQFSWTINPAGGGSCASPGQKLANPGFESGAASWTSSAGVIGQWGSQGEPTHGGTWNAWMDGYGRSHTDTVSQSVTIPSGCGNSTLSFWLHVDSSETTTSVAYDKLTVTVGSTTLATFSNLNKAAGYQLRSFNVGSFAGQTVTVKFTGTEDVSLQTSFVLDDTALTAG